MNKVILVGRVGNEPETRNTSSGKTVTNFSLATDEGKDKTEWHSIVAWNDKFAEQCVGKGDQLAIEGRLQTRSWEDKEGNKRYKTEVVAWRIEGLSKAAEKKQQQEDLEL